VAGRWSDPGGRRRLMLAGAGVFAVLVLGHLLVTGLIELVALRLMLGAAEALFFVAGFAMLAEIAPAGRAGEALSYASLALFTGLALGAAAGSGAPARGRFPAGVVGRGPAGRSRLPVHRPTTGHTITPRT
jgi:MFS family permease